MRIALSGRRQKAAPYVAALTAAGLTEPEIEIVSAEGAPVHARDFDGAVFAGGSDIDPAHYRQAKRYDIVEVDSARDAFELKLLEDALRERIPILGICRGLQLINVYLGGTLYQDLQLDRATTRSHRQQGPRSELTHAVELSGESRLQNYIPQRCMVNSLHHQGVDEVAAKHLKVTARSAEDGIIEALEPEFDYPFLLAVQWHPEEICDRDEQRAIFSSFLEHATLFGRPPLHDNGPYEARW